MTNCSRNSPFSNIQREGFLAWFTSQHSATMRYFIMPESETRVLTPYDTIIETESLGLTAGAVCSRPSWHAAAANARANMWNFGFKVLTC